MRILVTGSSGFVGRYVIDELKAAGHEPVRADNRKAQEPSAEPEYVGDLRDPAFSKDIITREKPDGCIHLAGIAFVPMGWSDPSLVFSVNVQATLSLLEAFREIRPDARVLVVSSAEVYGREIRKEVLHEQDELRPENLYAVSKMAADLSALLYARQYDMSVMTARPQNHIGPGQSRRFVTTDFAHQLAEIAQGRREPLMRVGNLESERDFLDVRDVARAYRLLMEKGNAGHAYNIASGHTVPIRHILDRLMSCANVQPRIEVDTGRFRPTDRQPRLSTDRIHGDTGWEPRFSIEETLKEIYAAASSGS